MGNGILPGHVVHVVCDMHKVLVVYGDARNCMPGAVERSVFDCFGYPGPVIIGPAPSLPDDRAKVDAERSAFGRFDIGGVDRASRRPYRVLEGADIRRRHQEGRQYILHAIIRRRILNERRRNENQGDRYSYFHPNQASCVRNIVMERMRVARSIFPMTRPAALGGTSYQALFGADDRSAGAPSART